MYNARSISLANFKANCFGPKEYLGFAPAKFRGRVGTVGSTGAGAGATGTGAGVGTTGATAGASCCWTTCKVAGALSASTTFAAGVTGNGSVGVAIVAGASGVTAGTRASGVGARTGGSVTGAGAFNTGGSSTGGIAPISALSNFACCCWFNNSTCPALKASVALVFSSGAKVLNRFCSPVRTAFSPSMPKILAFSPIVSPL